MDSLRKLMADAYQDHVIAEMPRFPKYRAGVKTRRKIVWLIEEEQDRVLQCVPAEHRPIVVFCLYQGVRIGEARALRWPSVDLKRGVATIESTFSGSELNSMTKDGKDRDIPFTRM